MKRATGFPYSAVIFALLLSGGQAYAVGNDNFDRGIELYKNKNYEAAAKSFAESARVNTKNAGAYYYLANCSYAMGHRDEAIKQYWSILHYFPTAREAYYARSFLKQIDGDYSKHLNDVSPGQLPVQAKTKEADPSERFSPPEISKNKLIENILHVVKSQGNRPEVSNTLIEEAKKTLANYPTGLLMSLITKGCYVCLTPTTIDQDPRMQNTKPRGYEEGTTYKNCPGFFDGEHIVVCEYALRGSDDSHWEPTEDPIGTLRHELGHAFDYCLGNISTSEAFKHAYYLDAGSIDEEAKPRLAYFLQTSRSGLAETFAELAQPDRFKRFKDIQSVPVKFKQRSSKRRQSFGRN